MPILSTTQRARVPHASIFTTSRPNCLGFCTRYPALALVRSLFSITLQRTYTLSIPEIMSDCVYISTRPRLCLSLISLGGEYGDVLMPGIRENIYMYQR